MACSAHTKASGDHRASTRCVSRILACALRRDGRRRRRRRVIRFSSPLYAADEGANGERLAFLPVGRFLRPLLFLPLSPASFFSSRRVFLTKNSGRYLEENSLFSPATKEIPPCTSITGEPGVADVSVGHWSEAEGRRGGTKGRESKSAQRGWKRNCFVSESTVCVLT